MTNRPVTAVVQKLLRSLLPRACPGCGESLGAAAGLCASCAVSLTVRVESHSMLSNAVTPHLVVLGQHKGLLRRAARELKYSGHRDLAGVLGQALTGAGRATELGHSGGQRRADASQPATSAPFQPRRDAGPRPGPGT